MNDIENLIKYVKDHSNNFLGSKATLKENETFEYMYDLLIETLEKQIPKKPKVMETTLVGEKFWWYCGHCGASLHTNTKHNHCSYCGGKVDWGNKDE